MATVVRTADSATGLELHVNEPASGLAGDYLDGQPALAPFYAGHPRDPQVFRSKAKEVQRRLTPAARAALNPAYRPTSPAAARKLARVLAGDGVMVTTGQQAGLFGGPLYTVYKILSAVQLAAKLETVLEQPVLAVFWVGSHDHDWAEVNHTHVVDADNELRRIEIEGDAEPPLAMYARRLGPPAVAAVNQMAGMLPNSEFATALIGKLGNAYQPERTMGAAFADLLHDLLTDFDLAIFDPAHEAAWPAAAPVIARELSAGAAHGELLAAQSARLEKAGYAPQVTIAADAANVFLHDDHGRDRLMRENGAWALRRTKRTLSDEDVTALVASNPERFSPNVLLRPVVESSMIPTIAYVGGPAEVSYFAQIGCLFKAHGIEPPVVIPRKNVMVVEGKVRKVLDKFSLEPGDFARPFDDLSTRVIQGELPGSVTESIDALRSTVIAKYEVLTEGGASIDPTLRGWLTSNRNSILSQLEAAGKKVTSHLKKRSEVELEQLHKAAVNLYPGGIAQERMLGPVPFLARYGPGFLQDVARELDYAIDRSADGWTGVECD